MEKRAKLVYILQLLQRLTDDKHGLYAEELERELQEVGLRGERKGIYHDILALQEMGYDVQKSRKASRGFYLNSRTFEVAELRILMDAVQSAGFLTERKTGELLEKLKTLASVYQAKELAGQIHMSRKHKTKNQEVIYSIDAIQQAITDQKKISFTYHRVVMRNNKPSIGRGKKFTLSPYALLWETDRYYLVGNYEKYDNLSHYRLDRIRSVGILDQRARDIEEVSDYEGVFNTADYLKRNFNMFGGEEESAQLSCSLRGLEILLDKFGDDMHIEKVPCEDAEESYLVTVQVNRSEGLMEWLVQFGSHIQVVSPQSLRDGVKNRIVRTAEVYGMKIEENQPENSEIF